MDYGVTAIEKKYIGNVDYEIYTVANTQGGLDMGAMAANKDMRIQIELTAQQQNYSEHKSKEQVALENGLALTAKECECMQRSGGRGKSSSKIAAANYFGSKEQADDTDDSFGQNKLDIHTKIP